MKQYKRILIILMMSWIIGGSVLLGSQQNNCKVNILGLTPKKEVCGIGETISWSYCYEGPIGEGEYRERWFCRKEGEEWQLLFERPTALFEQGKYEVGLQLQDADGNWSDLYVGSVEIGKEIISQELAYTATRQVIGNCVENLSRTNYRGYPEIPHHMKQLQEGTLILSNSPENVKQEGVLYRSFFKGAGTLFVHHIQGFKDTEKRAIEVTLQNLSTQSVKLSVERKTFKGPHQNVVWMGQSVLLDYLGRKDKTSHIIRGEDRFVLYREEKWQQKDVISALMGLEVDGPVMIEVRVYKPGDEKSGKEALARDVHPRGTFYGGSRIYEIDYKQDYGIRTLVLGERDEWIYGKDALTGEIVANKGNYGVPHVIEIKTEEEIDIFLNPRGDMFKGAICWDYEEVYAIPQKGCLKNQQKLIYLGHVKKGEERKLIYMLPSASAAPVVMVFVPE